MREAELGIVRSVSGGVLVWGVVGHRRNWRRKRRVGVREALADGALSGFGKSRRN